MQTRMPSLLAATLFLLSLPALAVPPGEGTDRQRPFRRGIGNGARGNERSERPGRFSQGAHQYAGNGCPDGTMRIVFSPDGLSFSILYDRFVADTAQDSGRRVSRMSCDSVVPFSLPPGQQMEITRVDYRGFVALPQGARAALHSSYNFTGPGTRAFGRGNGFLPPGWRNRDRIVLNYDFTGPLTDNYEVSTGAMGDGRGVAQSEVSPCGGEAQLLIHNDLVVAAKQGEEASLTIDSVDGSANSVYYVSWKSCRADPGGERPPRGRPNGLSP